MRLPRGSLTKLETSSGISNIKLCDYIATRVRPGRKRALELEAACRNLGIDVPAMIWLYGSSDEIKQRVLEWHNGNGKKPETAPENQAGVKPKG